MTDHERYYEEDLLRYFDKVGNNSTMYALF